MKKCLKLINVVFLISIILNFLISLIVFLKNKTLDQNLLFINVPIVIIWGILIIVSLVLSYIYFFKNSEKDKIKVIVILSLAIICLILSILYGIKSIQYNNGAEFNFLLSDKLMFGQDLGKIYAYYAIFSLGCLVINDFIISFVIRDNITRNRYLNYGLIVILFIVIILIGDILKNLSNFLLTLVVGALVGIGFFLFVYIHS